MREHMTRSRTRHAKANRDSSPSPEDMVAESLHDAHQEQETTHDAQHAQRSPSRSTTASRETGDGDEQDEERRLPPARGVPTDRGPFRSAVYAVWALFCALVPSELIALRETFLIAWPVNVLRALPRIHTAASNNRFWVVRCVYGVAFFLLKLSFFWFFFTQAMAIVATVVWVLWNLFWTACGAVLSVGIQTSGAYTNFSRNFNRHVVGGGTVSI